MQSRTTNKAAFNGSIANRRRHRSKPARDRGFDLQVTYQARVATVRALTDRGRHFTRPLSPVSEFDHAAAFILARSARDKGFRVHVVGEPSLKSIAAAGLGVWPKLEVC